MKKLLFLLVTLLLASCEKMLVEDTNSEEGNVILKFSPYKMGGMTRGSSSAELAECITKLNLMVFDDTNDKVFDKIKLQKNTDENFGTFNINLPEGTYTVISVGHSGGSSVSIPSVSEVRTTTNNGVRVTDTHYYYGTIDVTEEPKYYELPLRRNTAKFRLIMTDSVIPEAASRLKFTYKGGSYNFNPKTGLGLPNKTTLTQNEYREISEDKIAEVYTFPYSTDTCYINMTVVALDDSDTELMTHIFENIPILTDQYTEFEGRFFDDTNSTITHSSFGFTINPEWKGVMHFEY